VSGRQKAEGRRQRAESKAEASIQRLELNEQPSPLGRGWPAAGAFISRSGTGEGFLRRPSKSSRQTSDS